MRSRRTKVFGVVGLALALLLVAGAGIAYANRQYLQDFFAARQYVASEDMQTVIDRVQFTESGDIIFRASNPTLDATQGFNEQCSEVIHRESDQVVGCYTGTDIHLFQITDQRLDGMVEVTAAHELLHAAYARLSPAERANLVEQLRNEYTRALETNPELAERMSVYKDLDDDAFVNELHSVLGTEVKDLSPQLESHYAQYFQSRSGLLELFNQYNAYFDELDAQRNELRSQLESLGRSIESRTQAYEAALAAYNADVEDFTARNSRYEFANDVTSFYSIRDQLNTRRASLEVERLDLNSQIADYNVLREQLLALDATAQELIESISSNLAPPAST